MQLRRTSSAVEIAVVLAFCAFLFFYGLGSFGLVGADEPRYAQIAREMLARHDWITPVLNGAAWLEKPVLYYWGAMVSYSVFGVSDWAARVPTAFMTTLMVMAVYGFMRRFRSGSQVDAALITATLAGTIGFARAASTDMPLTSMFTIGMIGWFAWYETGWKRFLVVFYFFMALGTLAKGPVAPFLAALIIVVFAGLRRDWMVILRTLWWPGIVVFVAVALPWFVLVQRANPQFVRVFIFEHNLARYGSNMFRHSQPFWYFGPVLLLGLLPWTVLAIAAIVRAFRRGIGERSSFELFFGLWAVLPVIFFSFSGSKLPGYILPAVPPFAILLAEYLWRRIDEGDEPRLWLSALHALAGATVLAFALLSNYFILKMKIPPMALWIALGAGVITFAAMTAAIYGTGLKAVRTATLLPLLLGLAFVIKFASPAIDARDSQRPVNAALNATKAPKVAVFGARREVEYGLNFYRDQSIPNYERGEIPAEAHVVVTRSGYRDRLQLMVPMRTVSPVGEFAAQKLEFFLVGAK